MLRLQPTQINALRVRSASPLRDQLHDTLQSSMASAGFRVQRDGDTGLLLMDRDERESRIDFSQGTWHYRNAAGDHISYTFDLFGRLVCAKDAKDHTTAFEYSEQQRLPTAVRSPEGERTSLAYNDSGQLTSIRYGDGRSRHYQYAKGRLVALLLDDLVVERRGYPNSGPKYSSWWIEDGAGNRTEATATKTDDCRILALRYPDGRVLTHHLDAQGRFREVTLNGQTLITRYQLEGMLGLRYADGSWRAIRFDDDGQVDQAATADHQTHRSYQHGRLAVETIDGYRTEFDHDRLGDILTITTKEQQQSFARQSGRLSEVKAWGDRIALQREAPGVETIRFSSGVSQTLDSSEPRLYASTLRDPGGKVLFSEQCLVDIHDRVALQVEHHAGKQYTASYRHDVQGRLVAESNDGAAEDAHYALDVVGNRMRYEEQDARYDSLNRLVQLGAETFRYDAWDNLSERHGGKEHRHYVFSQGNRLVAVCRDGKLVARYAYDALGRRCSKWIGKTRTTYRWADDRLIGEVRCSPDGTERRVDYLWAGDLPRLLGMRIDGVIYHVACDQRLAPRLVMNQSGHIVWRARYSSFGECEIMDAEIEQPIRLPGQYADAESGLYYNLSRYYDPALGRYLSPDSRRELGGQLNLYTYCDGDPLSRIDPRGEAGVSPRGQQGNRLDTVGDGVVEALEPPMASPADAGGDFVYDDETYGAVVGQTLAGSCPPVKTPQGRGEDSAMGTPLAQGCGQTGGGSRLVSAIKDFFTPDEPDCDYLEGKHYLVAGSPEDWEGAGFEPTISATKEIRHAFPGQTRKEALSIYKVDLRGQTVEIGAPKEVSLSEGQYMPTVQQVARGLAKVPAPQRADLKAVILSPYPKPTSGAMQTPGTTSSTPMPHLLPGPIA